MTNSSREGESCYRMRCLLMSSMVKVEYSASSCWSWGDSPRVKRPYIGAETSWIRICWSGDELSYRQKTTVPT